MTKFSKILLESLLEAYSVEEVPGGYHLIWSDGNIEYFDKQMRLHREDGPAMSGPSGYEAWHFHGRLHRIGGPAITHVSGQKEYFVNGNRMDKSEYDRHFGND